MHKSSTNIRNWHLKSRSSASLARLSLTR